MTRETAMNFLRCAAIAGCIAMGLLSSAHAAEPVRIIVGGIEKQIYLPATLAARLGYFKEQELDVELLSEPSGVNAEDELLAGSVQGVVGFYDHTIDLQAKGKFVQSVVQFCQAPGEAEVVAAHLAGQIRSPADFKGRTLGVTGLGSSTHLLTQYLAMTHGLKRREIHLRAVGSGATFVAAMTRGDIDAGMTTEPTVSHLLKTGAAELLVDMRTPQSAEKVLGGTYPAASLYMTTLWINTHKVQVQKLANALVKALRYINSHSAEEIAAQLPADFEIGDRAVYVEALRDSKSMFTPDGRMPASGPATALRVLQVVDKAVIGKTIDLSKTHTNEFVAAAR
jgi:NitT/TauT family transport system substrate-binding protein